MKLEFKDWLQKVKETATTTGDVAHFARPIMGMVRRKMDQIKVLNDKRKKKQD